MTAARQDHIDNALAHVSEDSTALDHMHTALHALEQAYIEVEPVMVGHVELEEEIAGVRCMVNIVRERVNLRVLEEAERAANLVAQDVVETIRSRSEQDGPIQWLTGNSFMPPLRSLFAAERIWQEGTDDAWHAFSDRFFEELDRQQILCQAPEYDNALYCVDLRVWESAGEDAEGDDLADEWARIAPEPEKCDECGASYPPDARTVEGPFHLESCSLHVAPADDPVAKNQSKHRDAEGTLRYDADDSEVFPGATGVRKPANDESIGKLGEWDPNA